MLSKENPLTNLQCTVRAIEVCLMHDLCKGGRRTPRTTEGLSVCEGADLHHVIAIVPRVIVAPVGPPNVKSLSGIDRSSHNCSGMRPIPTAKRSMAFIYGTASRPAAN